MNNYILTQAGEDDIEDMELNFHWWRKSNKRRQKKLAHINVK